MLKLSHYTSISHTFSLTNSLIINMIIFFLVYGLFFFLVFLVSGEFTNVHTQNVSSSESLFLMLIFFKSCHVYWSCHCWITIVQEVLNIPVNNKLLYGRVVKEVLMFLFVVDLLYRRKKFCFVVDVLYSFWENPHINLSFVLVVELWEKLHINLYRVVSL